MSTDTNFTSAQHFSQQFNSLRATLGEDVEDGNTGKQNVQSEDVSPMVDRVPNG